MPGLFLMQDVDLLNIDQILDDSLSLTKAMLFMT